MESTPTPLTAAQRTMLRARAQSRLNGQCAALREAHVELDAIEARLASLREHQEAFLLRAATPAPARDSKTGSVETIDLRSPTEVDTVSAQLDRTTSNPDSTTTPNRHEDDFDTRFAAFAARENDDSSRRWLDG